MLQRPDGTSSPKRCSFEKMVIRVKYMVFSKLLPYSFKGPYTFQRMTVHFDEIGLKVAVL